MEGKGSEAETMNPDEEIRIPRDEEELFLGDENEFLGKILVLLWIPRRRRRRKGEKKAIRVKEEELMRVVWLILIRWWEGYWSVWCVVFSGDDALEFVPHA